MGMTIKLEMRHVNVGGWSNIGRAALVEQHFGGATLVEQQWWSSEPTFASDLCFQWLPPPLPPPLQGPSCGRLHKHHHDSGSADDDGALRKPF